MTQAQASTLAKALDRALKQGVRVVARGYYKASGVRFIAVSSGTVPGRAYPVSIFDTHLSCPCKAEGICKHRALVHALLVAKRKAQRQAEHDARANRPITIWK